MICKLAEKIRKGFQLSTLKPFSITKIYHIAAIVAQVESAPL